LAVSITANRAYSLAISSLILLNRRQFLLKMPPLKRL
jgi:hypothetical protein